ncbi:MAG: dTMP kinase [Planctomycetaceae bacterium]
MGRLVAIEGIDGSGKGTQAARLAETLKAEGRTVALLGFPRYDATFFGARIGEFLNGVYGELDHVHPMLAAMLYAGDRWESKELLLESIDTHEYVILDRYVASNAAHQGAKFEGAERTQLWQQIEHLEHTLYALPRPDRVILLDIPADVSRTLIARKAARNYTSKTTDLQEADTNYQRRVRECYLELAREQSHWRKVDVVHGDVTGEELAIDDQLRPIDDVAADVRAAVD